MAAISLDPTIWGATRTTTFTTIATGTPGEVVYFNFPILTASQSLDYTTLPSPTASNSKQFPNGQPILVLTQVNGVIMNPQGQVLSTATVVQAPPPLYPTLPPGGKVNLVEPSYKWSTWSAGERAGVIVAIVLAILGLLAALWYICGLRRKRKRMEKDMEKGPKGGGTGGKKQKRWTKGQGNLSSGQKNGPRGIEGMENVEMGPAARRSVHGEPSSAPTRRSVDYRTSRRSQRSPGHRESDQRPPADVSTAGATRTAELPVLPIGQRPLNPPNPASAMRTEARQSEGENQTGPSNRTVRTEAREAQRAAHNPLADDDDDVDMEHIHPRPPPALSKAARKRLGTD
ncbi:MAG: hypothetical protein M1830_005446 [Pleopsidium flavum]|nr:MAG: hypothetical protein M1830_005446 [Pleopsidium flavum]